MQNNNIGLIVLGVVILIIAVYYFNQNSTARQASADVAIQNIAPPCVPFTKAQQDAEKRKKRADCANKLLIPFVGQAQWYACYKNVDASLTPIVNC